MTSVLQFAVPEMFAWDWLELLSDCAVDGGLSSFFRGFQEHREESKQQGHQRRMTHQLWPHRPRMHRVHSHIRPWSHTSQTHIFCWYHFSYSCQIIIWVTLESARQLTSEKHVSEFALAVGKAAVVAALTVQVVESNPAEVMCQGGNDHDSWRSAALQQTNEEIRQQVVTWIKKGIIILVFFSIFLSHFISAEMCCDSYNAIFFILFC